CTTGWLRDAMDYW
nr:immunoglobulin heavy chain junction region [Mus musculus]NSM05573.1 immunoglobulin heavy chain junction region [Mus musculus]NSM06857.1 immunoglobulin heavy chain junction region [Mus musculus]NSM09151.1 immunoglobulin heavy chain junction region [Mus musculus]